jgi:hypothetical protein
LKTRSKSAAPATVSLHPALADLYKENIGKLANVLKDPKICDPAKLLIRELIERVDVTYNGPIGIYLLREKYQP